MPHGRRKRLAREHHDGLEPPRHLLVTLFQSHRFFVVFHRAFTRPYYTITWAIERSIVSANYLCWMPKYVPLKIIDVYWIIEVELNIKGTDDRYVIDSFYIHFTHRLWFHVIYSIKRIMTVPGIHGCAASWWWYAHIFDGKYNILRCAQKFSADTACNKNMMTANCHACSIMDSHNCWKWLKPTLVLRTACLLPRACTMHAGIDLFLLILSAWRWRQHLDTPLSPGQVAPRHYA